MSLDTLANVKARLGVVGSADDALLDLLRESATASIANYCDRDFLGGSFTELHPGESFVFLRNFPVASVTSVKVDASRTFGPESLVSSDDYVVHSDRGVIQWVNGPLPLRSRTGLVNGDLRLWTADPQVVQVIYTTATSAVPDDVKEAFARLVGHGYRRVKTDQAANFQSVAQQKYGETFVIFERRAESAIPVDVASMLAPYRGAHL